MAILEYQLRVVGEADIARALASTEARFVRHQRVINQTLASSGISASRARNPGQASQQLATAQRAAFRSFDDGQRKIFESTKRYETSAFRFKLQNVERLKREEIAKIRAVNRAAERETKAARASFARGIGTGATNGAHRLAAVGKAGLATLGVGGSVLAGAAVTEQLKLDEQVRRLAIAGRGPGETGRDPEQLRKQITGIGMQTGIAPEQIAAGAQAFVAKTGDIETATANMKNFAIVAQATGSSVEDVASTAADLSQKFDIKGTNEMADALAVLAFQGKKGAFELKDMAEQFPEMAAAAQRAGLRGVGGMRTLGGLAQIARQSTGSGAEASTALTMAMTQLTNKAGDLHQGIGLGGKRVDVFEGGDATKHARDLPTVLAEVISRSHGNMTQLSKVFDVRGIRAVSPMIDAYRSASEKAGGGAKGEKAGYDAVLAMIKDASEATGTFADVQKDAADVMKATSIQFELAMMELKSAAADELLPTIKELAPEVKKLAPAVRFAAQEAVALASALLNNPLAGVGAVMAASIAKEVATAQISQALSTGIVSPLGVAGLAVTAFAGALAAAKLWVDQQFAEGKQKAEAAAKSGDEVRDQAKSELDATGKISPETMDKLRALNQTESATMAGADAVSKEGWLSDASRAWNQFMPSVPQVGANGQYDFGAPAPVDPHNLTEKATLLAAGGNDKYTAGVAETKRLLQVGDTAQGLSGADAKAAFGAINQAADKLDKAADKIAGITLNRSNSPSPVSPVKG
jgi:TP901 family phage tail tape measure protein